MFHLGVPQKCKELFEYFKLFFPDTFLTSFSEEDGGITELLFALLSRSAMAMASALASISIPSKSHRLNSSMP
jgi:hypothetical protein